MVKSTAQVYGETEVQGGEQKVTLNVRGEVRVWCSRYWSGEVSGVCRQGGVRLCTTPSTASSSPAPAPGPISCASSNCRNVPFFEAPPSPARLGVYLLCGVDPHSHSAGGEGAALSSHVRVLRIRFMQSFETVMAAIGTHISSTKVKLELQRCDPSRASFTEGGPSDS